MKHRFNKNELQFLDSTLHGRNEARNFYWLQRKMDEEKYYSKHDNRELLALERGANAGDDWCMHVLGLTLIRDKHRLPEGLSWLHKCIKYGNQSVWNDIKKNWAFIYNEIMNYDPKNNEKYANIEVQCAMLTAMLLTYFGQENWDNLSRDTKIYRIRDLAANVCRVCHIDDIKVEFSDNPHTDKCPSADGLAHLGYDKIEIAYHVVDNYERLIQVLFHELGHHIVWFMMWKPEPKQSELFKMFGLTKERIEKWKNNEKGYEITLFEEDPDTISYGVWWTYLLYFPFI